MVKRCGRDRGDQERITAGSDQIIVISDLCKKQRFSVNGRHKRHGGERETYRKAEARGVTCGEGFWKGSRRPAMYSGGSWSYLGNKKFVPKTGFFC